MIIVANEPRRIQFDDFLKQVQSIFDMLARQKEPVMVERAGRLFRVEAERTDEAQALWADYDGERVRTALRQNAGAFKDIDVEQLKRDLREERAQDSHGRPA